MGGDGSCEAVGGSGSGNVVGGVRGCARGGTNPHQVGCGGRTGGGGGGSGSSSGGGRRGGSGIGASIRKAMLRPPRRFRAPNCNLVEVVAVGELVGASIKDVEPLASLGEIGGGGGALGQPLRKWHAVVAAWAALALEEPLAMQEAAVDEEVVDVLLPRYGGLVQEVPNLLLCDHCEYLVITVHLLMCASLSSNMTLVISL